MIYKQQFLEKNLKNRQCLIDTASLQMMRVFPSLSFLISAPIVCFWICISFVFFSANEIQSAERKSKKKSPFASMNSDKK